MIPSKASRRPLSTFTVLLLSAATLLAGPGWVQVGPEGGEVTSLAAGPPGSGVLLAGTVGGFYRPEDFGASWSLWAPELIGTRVGGMQGAADGRHLLASLGPTPGLSTSDDGGLTWTSVTPPEVPPSSGQSVWLHAAVQAPSDPRVLYVTMRTDVPGGQRDTFFRSADRGRRGRRSLSRTRRSPLST